LKRVLVQIILLFFVIVPITAQEVPVTLSGKVIDSTNQMPLPFASIYVKGTSIGTASNEEGAFVFHVPKQFKIDTIIISMMGYGVVHQAVTDFKGEDLISLEESSFSLDEVVVTNEKSLTGKEIMKKAYQAISKNYPSEPYILEGFIRDLQNEDSVYVELLECAVMMRYKSNEVKNIPEVELVALKQSYVTEKHPWNDQWERKNSIIDLVEDDFIRFDYDPIKPKRKWKYEVESVIAFGDKLVYKINATRKPFFSAQLYIDMESYAFVRIDYTRAATKRRNYKRRMANGQQERYYNIVFEYQEFNGKWYLKYQKEEDVWNIYEGPESRKLIFTKFPKKELFINRVITEDVESFPFTNNLIHSKSVEGQAEPYNPDFWKFYNLPEQTNEQSKIEAYLKEADIQIKSPR